MRRYQKHQREEDFCPKIVQIIFACFCVFSLLTGMAVCLSKSPAQKSADYINLAAYYTQQAQEFSLSHTEKIALEIKIDNLFAQALEINPYDQSLAQEIARLKIMQTKLKDEKRFSLLRAQ